MAFTIGTVEKLYREYVATARLAGGDSVAVESVELALLKPGSPGPGRTTKWHPLTATGWGTWQILFSGPDAHRALEALPIPLGGADVWLRVIDIPEESVRMVEHIAVER